MASKDWQSQVKLGRSLNMESSFFRESTADSGQYDYLSLISEDGLYSFKTDLLFLQGFQNKTLSETSLPLEEIDNLIEEVQVDFNMVCL